MGTSDTVSTAVRILVLQSSEVNMKVVTETLSHDGKILGRDVVTAREWVVLQRFVEDGATQTLVMDDCGGDLLRAGHIVASARSKNSRIRVVLCPFDGVEETLAEAAQLFDAVLGYSALRRKSRPRLV